MILLISDSNSFSGWPLALCGVDFWLLCVLNLTVGNMKLVSNLLIGKASIVMARVHENKATLLLYLELSQKLRLLSEKCQGGRKIYCYPTGLTANEQGQRTP
jgi:hypothetical protein